MLSWYVACTLVVKQAGINIQSREGGKKGGRETERERGGEEEEKEEIRDRRAKER